MLLILLYFIGLAIGKAKAHWYLQLTPTLKTVPKGPDRNSLSLSVRRWQLWEPEGTSPLSRYYRWVAAVI